MTIDIPHSHAWIDGAWVETETTAPVVNPATLSHFTDYGVAEPALVDRAVQAARRAFDTTDWPRMTPQERAEILLTVLERYVAETPDLAALITQENASPVWFTPQTDHPKEILASMSRLAWVADPQLDGTTVAVHKDPVGVVAVVVPWNMPQKTILMKLAPALVAGCTAVIKPAPETPLDALVLALILAESGVPAGVVNVVCGGDETGQALVQHPGVDKVAFTGSTPVGSTIAAHCASTFKRCTLELGGKSPTLLAEDADLPAWAARLLVDSYLLSGQICSNQTRVLVPRAQHDEVVDLILATIDSWQVGNPLDPATQLGPLVSRAQHDKVAGYLRQAREEGGRVYGGTRLPRPGFYLRPALITGLDHSSAVVQEEIFGPVVSLHPYDDWDQAITLANDTPYGLAAGVWTTDPYRAEDAAVRLRAGTVHINGGETNCGHPLGGFKASGIGRELGAEGMEHYLETKVVAR